MPANRAAANVASGNATAPTADPAFRYQKKMTDMGEGEIVAGIERCQKNQHLKKQLTDCLKI